MAEPSTSVRLPPEIRARLELGMAQSGPGERSLNTEIIHQLRSGFNGNKVKLFWGALNLPPFVRMQTSSTSADLSRIRSLLETAQPQQLIFAAKQEKLNGAVLVMAMQFEFTTVVIDTTWLNMARDNRIREIEQLFATVDALGHLSIATYVLDYVPETADTSPADAFQSIQQSNPRPLNSLRPFLDLFSIHGLYDKTKFPTIDD